MDEIILSRGARGWVAEYRGPHLQDLRRLFGCDVLPTAFTSEAPAGYVASEIERLNPGVRVSLAPAGN